MECRREGGRSPRSACLRRPAQAHEKEVVGRPSCSHCYSHPGWTQTVARRSRLLLLPTPGKLGGPRQPHDDSALWDHHHPSSPRPLGQRFYQTFLPSPRRSVVHTCICVTALSPFEVLEVSGVWRKQKANQKCSSHTWRPCGNRRSCPRDRVPPPSP